MLRRGLRLQKTIPAHRQGGVFYVALALPAVVVVHPFTDTEALDGAGASGASLSEQRGQVPAVLGAGVEFEGELGKVGA